MIRRLMVSLAFGFFAFACGVCAQSNPNLEIGLRPYGSYGGGKIDSVALANGNLSMRIPLFSYPQRGSIPGNLSLQYSNKNWYVFSSCTNTNCFDQWKWNPRTPTGVYINFDGAWGASYTLIKPSTYIWTIYTGDGASHLMSPDNAGGLHSVDGSGIYYNGANPGNGLTSLVVMRDGSQPLAVDSNGNFVTAASVAGLATSAAVQSMTLDTLGRNPGGSSVVTSDYSGCIQPASPNQISSAVIITYPGTNRQIKECLAQYSLTTNFRQYDANAGVSINEGNTTAWFIVSVVLYNGSAWTSSPAWGFDYVSRDSGDPSTVNYGDLSKVTLPTGGTISYTWSKVTLCDVGVLPSPVSRGLATRTVDAQDGSGPKTWAYNINKAPLPSGSGSAYGTIVTDPAGNQTVHGMTTYGECTYYEIQTNYFSGSATSGTLLKTVKTDYTSSTAPYSSLISPTPPANVLPIRTTTIWPSGKTTKIEKDYDANFQAGSFGTYSYGRVTAVREFDYGTTANTAGPLLRTTTNAYMAMPSNSYFAANLLDLVSSVTVTDAGGSQTAKTTYGYDAYALQSSGITTQHDNAKASAVRGNRTSACRWLNTSGGNLCSTATYYDTGMPYQATDALGHVTTYSYSSTFAGAYVTQTNMPDTGLIHHAVSGTYDFNTGSLLSFVDQNNLTSSYSYDPLGRLSTANFPDSGQSTFAYHDVAPASVTATTKINSSQSVINVHLFDGLARPIQTQLTSNPQGTVYTDTTYDTLGRVSTVSNPHFSTSSSTDGITTYSYDAIDRTIKAIPPDGTTNANFVSTAYLDNCVTVTDQAGKDRKTCSDGLGRLTSAWENPSSLNYETDYTYDTLGNLITVNQKGGSANSANWRTRTFTYDSLSRLLCASNPENSSAPCPTTATSSYTTGTTGYVYDANGNLSTKTALAPNQTGTATVTTTYSYDGLNRLTQKSYSDGTTPSASYFYDQQAPWGWNLSNYIGRLTTESSGSTAELFSYDPMGRVTIREQCQPQNCPSDPSFLVAYAYNLLGGATSLQMFQSGVLNVTFSYAYDAAGRTTGLTSNLVDAQHPATLATIDPSIGYYPNGALRKITYGNGLTETGAYNNRLQPCRFNVNSSGSALGACTDAIPSGNVLDFSYGFNAGTSNNGNVAAWSAVGNQTFSRTYTYDSLNRIKTLADGATSQACKGLSWTIDAWGNRTDQTNTAGTCNTFHAIVGTNNRLGSPYQYDSAGNMTHDASHSYTYDAENRIIQVDGGSTATYLYNAEGQRVTKNSAGTWVDYLFDMSGNVVAETGAGGWASGYAYLNGQLIAEYGNSTTYFIHHDHLGSTRLMTKVDKTLYDNIDYLPYGEQTAGANGITFKFTGKERDTESGLDYFGARYYGSSMGRFMSPDPVKITPGRMANPQQLNLYSYVANNPLRFVDPDGETLQISGNVDEAQRQLCVLIGGDCSRISYNGDTHTITVNLTGIDLSQNEGASLLNDVVGSKNDYSLDLGSSMLTAGGLRSVTNDDPINLDNRADWRYGKGKSSKDLPPVGVDDAIGIDPNSRQFRDSKGNVVPLSSTIFHELAEAFAKVDGGMQYVNKDGSPGAHDAAVQRELTLRSQRPNMKLEGRAGDQLIRDPKPPKP